MRPGRTAQLLELLGRRVSCLWTGCIAGGVLAEERGALFAAAGFVDVEIVPGRDVFAGAPQQSSAADFGTRGAGIRAHR